MAVEDINAHRDAIAARVVLLISILIWGAFAALGWSGVESIRQQHAPGYPAPAQIHYYLVIPLVMTGLSLALFALTWQRRGGCLLAMLGGLLLAALPFYLFYYTGGM